MNDAERVAEIEARQKYVTNTENRLILDDKLLDYEDALLFEDVPYLIASIRQLEAELAVSRKVAADDEAWVNYPQGVD